MLPTGLYAPECLCRVRLGEGVSGGAHASVHGRVLQIFQAFLSHTHRSPLCLDKAHSCPPLHVLQSYEQAAAVLLAGATSLQALRKHTNVQEGSRVLILGGSGGTGVCGLPARCLLAPRAHNHVLQTHCSP